MFNIPEQIEEILFENTNEFENSLKPKNILDIINRMFRIVENNLYELQDINVKYIVIDYLLCLGYYFLELKKRMLDNYLSNMDDLYLQCIEESKIFYSTLQVDKYEEILKSMTYRRDIDEYNLFEQIYDFFNHKYEDISNERRNVRNSMQDVEFLSSEEIKSDNLKIKQWYTRLLVNENALYDESSFIPQYLPKENDEIPPLLPPLRRFIPMRYPLLHN